MPLSERFLRFLPGEAVTLRAATAHAQASAVASLLGGRLSVYVLVSINLNGSLGQGPNPFSFQHRAQSSAQ